MTKRKARTNRRMRMARQRRVPLRQSRIRWPFSIHRRAIELLHDQILKGTGLLCLFHGGAQWSAFNTLLLGNRNVDIAAEKSLRVRNRRWIPDLTVRCRQTGHLLLVIEVWHTHAVSAPKRRAYLEAGIPWIELKAWSVLYQVGKKALSILDWGGMGQIRSPLQWDLFSAVDAKPMESAKQPENGFDLRSYDWPMPTPNQVRRSSKHERCFW